MNDFISVLKRLPQTLKSTQLLIITIGAVVLGLLSLCLGIYFLMSGQSSAESNKDASHLETRLPLNRDTEPGLASKSGTTTQSVAEVVVNVSGAVKHPGIYSLPADARVFNALEAAGGVSKDADLGFIQRELNLADKIKEGEKIYFPPIQKETDTATSSVSHINGTDNLISINSASADELDTLPGIGEKLAAKIIEGRPYENITELTTRIKIGTAVFEKLKEQIKI